MDHVAALLLHARAGCTAFPAWPPWAQMWALAFAVYAGCKLLTWATVRRVWAPLQRQLGYLLLWPGMDAAAFLDRTRRADPPAPQDWMLGTANLLLGVALVFGVARLVPPELPYLTGWIGMLGIVLALHFGAFALLSCAFRAGGITAQPIMNWPLRARTLAEFWGRRWNLAFRDLTHRFLFRPLRRRLGPRGALIAGFTASGLVHDLVISLPAGGGFGGPTIYFVVQGVALAQRRTSRAWMFAVLLVPLPLLFHAPFVLRVIVPFLDAIGAIP